MPGHISCKYDANKSFTEGLEVVFREFFQEVVLVLIENHKGLGGVVVLLHGLIAVTNSSISNCIDVEQIIEAIVTKVMAHSRNYD